MAFQFQKDKHFQGNWSNLKLHVSRDLCKGGHEQGTGEWENRGEIVRGLSASKEKVFLYFFIVFLAWNLTEQPESCQTPSGS